MQSVHVTPSDNKNTDTATHSGVYAFIQLLIVFVICFRYTMLSEGSLRVNGVKLSDAGRYYCTVSNQAGSDHRGVDLRVFGKYSK